MQRMHFRLIGVGFVALLCVYPALAQPAAAPPLGTMLPQFGVLGGAGVTGSTGAGTSVNGDVGSSPTATILDFLGSTIPGPSRTVAPFIVHYTNDAVVQQAILDARAAWVNMGAQGALPSAIALAPQLNGVTLTTGIYNFAAAADLAAGGTLTLNGPGIFIFNVTSSLTANVGSMVVGTANPCNIYWRMGGGGSATLNGNNFWGTVIADQSVTVSSANNLIGRAVGIIGAVTMTAAGGNTIGGCSAAAPPPPPPPCPVITLTPATLPPGVVGAAYNQTITASGGTAPYTFSVASGALPTGLSLVTTSTTTAAVTGTTPTTPGLFNFTILATDANLCPVNIAYSIAIACPVITVSPATLPSPALATPYSQTITASGGLAPYSFTVSSGALPAGLSLTTTSTTTATITGTPSAVGVFSFTIQAADANGCLGATAYSFSIINSVGGPTLDFVGLAILIGLLAAAGVLLVNRFTM